MKQITLFDDLADMMRHGLLAAKDVPDPLELARKQRDTILIAQEVANGNEFGARMRAFIQEHLEKHGPSSGESITNAAKEAGIVPLRGDDRAYGGSYLSLSKRKVIVKAGSCQRAKGHSCNGGVVWGLNQDQK